MRGTDPEHPVTVRKFLRDQARKAVLWALEPEPGTSLPPHRPTPPTRTSTRSMDTNPYSLKGKTTLMLQSLLAIHESIEDADAWQGYEGTPDQLDDIRNEIYGILVMNPAVTDPNEVVDLWMEDYASTHLAEDQALEV
jgi:hypothetical protein